MFNPHLYLQAYGRLYSNDGAMTPGADGETVDDMSLGKIGRIIGALRRERYRVQLIARQATPAAITDGHPVPLRRSALRIPPGPRTSGHLAPFALRTALPSPLLRRDSHDYYGACVTIGLAPLRRVMWVDHSVSA